MNIKQTTLIYRQRLETETAVNHVENVNCDENYRSKSKWCPSAMLERHFRMSVSRGRYRYCAGIKCLICPLNGTLFAYFP